MRNRILEHMRQAGFKPCDESVLLRQLGLSRSTLHKEVRSLLASGELEQVQGDRLAPAQTSEPILARLVVKGSGRAFVRLEEDLGTGEIPVDENSPHTGMHGDRVRVQVMGQNRRGQARGRSGQVARILAVDAPARDTVVGTYTAKGIHGRVVPDDPRLPMILIANSGNTPAKNGDKVSAALHPWHDGRTPPTGSIRRVLGRQWEPGAELLGVLEKFNLPENFPEAVEKEASRLPKKVRVADLRGRLDYRDTPTLTIDPADAKDFDDALSIEEMDGGLTRIGVHIADVSAYVVQNSALDREARLRGNSTYLVGAVIPMLPKALSNGLCSLVEGEERLTVVVLLSFDKKAKLRALDFGRAVIRSRKRLSYEQAQALLMEDSLDKIRALPSPPRHQTGSTGRALNGLSEPELKELQGYVRKLWSIAAKLRKARMDGGSLDLEMPETRILVDAAGRAETLLRSDYNESHQLIEEFMLAANEAVAKETRVHKLPAVYRVHASPDPVRLEEFRQFAGSLGLRCGPLSDKQEVKHLLEAANEHPQGHLLKTQFLRSLAKACYKASPEGHYGLHKKDYAHFTSPIRRYADLVVHRALVSRLQSEARRNQESLGLPAGSELVRLAEDLSATESNSQEAERESRKIKLLEYFERILEEAPKTRFEAVVTDIKPAGLFIELTESFAFGLIPMSELRRRDLFPDRQGKGLSGRRSGERMTVGSKLQVRIAAVDRRQRLVDFVPA